MKSRLTDNLGSKLLALFIAVLLWFHAVTEKNYSVTRPVPLKVKNIPANLQIISDLPGSLLVTMRARGKILIELKFFKPYAEIDLRRAREGKNRVTVTPSDIKIPNDLNVRIESIEPMVINIELARKIRKKVSIVPLITGLTLNSYAVSRVKIIYPEDGKATLIGPAVWIKNVTHVFTDSISLNHLKGDSTFSVKIIPPDPRVKVLPESAKVKIFLEPREEARVKIPISFRNLGKNYDLRASHYYLFLTVSGAPSVLKDTTRITAYIDLKKFPPGDYILKPEVETPRLIDIVDVEPREVLVKIRKIGVKYPF